MVILMTRATLSATALAAAALTILPVAAISTPAEAHGRYYRSYGIGSGYYGHRYAPYSFAYRGYRRHATFGGYRYRHFRGGLGISLRSGR